MAGKPWYNNSVVEIQRGYNEEIPDGFIKGRLPKSNEARIKLSKSLNSRTEEQKKESNLKRSESLKATYRNMSEERKAALREKRRIIYYSRAEEQMLEYRKKLSASLIGKNKGRPGWRKGLTKDTDERIKSSAEKLSETLK